MIPKRIHYVWVGGPMPDRYRVLVDHWRHLHPDWELVHWSERNIDFSHAPLREAYRRRQWARVSDIARLLAVHRHGGIYLDTDFKVLKPLDPLLDNQCFLSFQDSPKPSDLLANGCLGAVPGHWFIGEALEAALRLRSLPFGLDRPTRSGPKLVTRLMRRHGLRAETADVQAEAWIGDIRIYPWRVFFPYPHGGEFTPDCITEDTLAVHLWERSWSASLPRHIRLAQAARSRVSRVLHSLHT
ncbi:glycosyltransferase family 32 protein [Teichococcus aestuarii]|uniref:Mannosyltransferase n=1 Tax=Teichococcus aestuarii TaxID=568898 RepID=A0A2U1V179_9PROT|nr:glycosyltransferase [Pseudoroseomonas aestuarii]PWC27621.1 hypothetical protein CR165_16490 [Pseudoroseomonas aestuarii]